MLGWPVSGPVTSGYGSRWGRMHEGIDISVAQGTPVRAAAAGTVIHAGWLGGYGNLVVVDHGSGLSTAYAHNSSFASSVGQSVAAGQVVSYSGNTGQLRAARTSTSRCASTAPPPIRSGTSARMRSRPCSPSRGA